MPKLAAERRNRRRDQVICADVGLSGSVKTAEKPHRLISAECGGAPEIARLSGPRDSDGGHFGQCPGVDGAEEAAASTQRHLGRAPHSFRRDWRRSAESPIRRAARASCGLKVVVVLLTLTAMMRSLLLTLMLAAAAGCAKSAETAPVVVSDPSLPTQAQPKLQTMKIYVGAEEMVAELALTQDQLRTGMMFRTNMAENASMLFPLPYTQRASFWMKNCPLPLSAAYIDPEGIIQEIHELEPYNTNSVISASDNIRFVLEAPQGWFKRHHIGTGVAIATERGPLMQTFFRRQ